MQATCGIRRKPVGLRKASRPLTRHEHGFTAPGMGGALVGRKSGFERFGKWHGRPAIPLYTTRRPTPQRGEIRQPRAAPWENSFEMRLSPEGARRIGAAPSGLVVPKPNPRRCLGLSNFAPLGHPNVPGGDLCIKVWRDARGQREAPPIHGLEAHATHKPTGETPVPHPIMEACSKPDFAPALVIGICQDLTFRYSFSRHVQL